MTNAIALDYGAFLVGGLLAFTCVFGESNSRSIVSNDISLTGMVNVQTYAYYQLYPKDGRVLKSIVGVDRSYFPRLH
jgi:hypothetical protein